MSSANANSCGEFLIKLQSFEIRQRERERERKSSELKRNCCQFKCSQAERAASVCLTEGGELVTRSQWLTLSLQLTDK